MRQENFFNSDSWITGSPFGKGCCWIPNSQCIKIEYSKILGEHKVVNLYDLGLWNGFLDITPKSWATKEKKKKKRQTEPHQN